MNCMLAPWRRMPARDFIGIGNAGLLIFIATAAAAESNMMLMYAAVPTVAGPGAHVPL
jgi:hypothetical protein